MTNFEIPSHFFQAYTTNVEMLLRRLGPTFLGLVGNASYSGEAAQVVKQFGDVEFRDKGQRHSDTVFDELIHKQRWIYPNDYVLAIPVDSQDELRLLDSPLSPYAEAGRLAYGKKIDDIIIPAFFADAKTGKNGGTTTQFDSNNVIAVTVGNGGSGNVGLNVSKLRAARKLLLQKNVDIKAEQPMIGVTASELDNLLSSTSVTSADYNTVKALVNGDVDTFLGFKFIHSEGLPQDGSGYTRCPVWVKSGMVYGQWQGLVTNIGPRPDKDYLTQIHMAFTAGATRVNEDKVLEIKCNPSGAAGT